MERAAGLSIPKPISRVHFRAGIAAREPLSTSLVSASGPQSEPSATRQVVDA